MSSFIKYALLVTLAGLPILGWAQAGVSISPPRTYFTLNPGTSELKKIKVSNPGEQNTLQMAVSLADWEYDSLGNNVVHEIGTLKNSCASWITISPQTAFSLSPGESKDLDVILNVPANLDTSAMPVHTAMIYVTQLNPIDDPNQKGAHISVAVRTGVKIYHRLAVERHSAVDIQGFAYEDSVAQQRLRLTFENTGNVWADGTVSCDLLNSGTGDKVPLKEAVFYSLPGNKRILFFDLPADLPKGRYTATAVVNYGDVDQVTLAELDFVYKKP